ncbi:hypothetical protein ACEWY4_006292 [Coilia grayii]|uniref:Protein Largen n=1 Tax=Coilia grayii TaxID=363190 RepID=A0ABD1KDC5_9TELE
MHSPSSSSSVVADNNAPGPARRRGPAYALLHPASATHGQCYCHLCAHDGPSPTVAATTAPALEFRYGPRSQASPEEEVGAAALEGRRDRRPFPSHRRRRESSEEGLERNGVVHGGGSHVPARNTARRVDFYLGPNHCAVLGDCTPAFPREWDPCYSSPARWNWPAAQPYREHCACTRDIRLEWNRTPLTPPPPPMPQPPPSPCCYPPERQPLAISHGPHQHPPEFRGHLQHGEVIHGGGGGLEEPCWECVRDQYWRDRHRPDLIAVESVCSYNGQHQQSLSPVLSFSHMPAYTHQSLSRQTSPEHGTCNGPVLGQRTFFTTEVSPSKLRGSEESGSCRPKMVNGRQRREPELEGQKEKESNAGQVDQQTMSQVTAGDQKSQVTVRDQIRRVVGDLEEVLGGLKQVHLEMREVVQQIDVLTSNIDLGDDEESNRQTSHEPLLQQQAVCHEVKALVHRPAETAQHLPEPQLQLQGINGHSNPMVPATPPASSKPSTCHPPVTRRGHPAPAAGDLHRVKAPGLVHGAARDRTKMNGSCVAPRPPRDRVKDAQRRRLELASVPLAIQSSSHPLLPANGSAAPVENHKPPPYPNHNGRVETLHKDPDGSLGSLRTAAHTGKGRQLSTAV